MPYLHDDPGDRVEEAKYEPNADIRKMYRDRNAMQALYNLRADPIVRKVRISGKGLRISFITGYKDFIDFKHAPLAPLYGERELFIRQQYRHDDRFFLLPHRDIVSASMVQRVLQTHRVVHMVLNSEEPPLPPHSHMSGVYHTMVDVDVDEYGGAMKTWANGKRAKELILPYFLGNWFTRVRAATGYDGFMRLLVRAMRRCIRNRHNVTWLNIMRYATVAARIYSLNYPYHDKIQSVPSPALFLRIFQRLCVTGTVMDPYPDYGSRAFAAARMGCDYATSGSFPRIEKFLRTTFAGTDGHADVVVLDFLFDKGGRKEMADRIRYWRQRADRVLLLVREEDARGIGGRRVPLANSFTERRATAYAAML